MTTKERFEAAEKIAEMINGNAWCPDQGKEGRPVRVYLKNKNGFVSVENDGINIDPVKRGSFEDVKNALNAAGYKTYRR